MTAVLNPAVARLVAEGRMDGSVIQNVTHWDLETGDWNEAALNDLIASYASWLSVHMAPLTSQALSWTTFRAQQLAGEEGLRSELTPGTPIAGQLSANSVPNNAALCATIATPYAGKSGRGRMYLAGVPVTMVVRSRVSQGHIDDLNAALLQLTTGSEFTGLRLGVYSTIVSGAPRAVGLFRRATLVAIRDDVLDSQRRRLPGRGA